MVKLVDKLYETSVRLKVAGIKDAEREAEALMCLSLNVDKSALYCRDSTEREDEAAIERLNAMTSLRLARRPFQYIAGEIEFFGLTLAVGPGVLIPRPETERLVEILTGIVGGTFKADIAVLDLCTGSGCIALALAERFPESIVHAVDISSDALRYASSNASRNCISNVVLHRGNLYEPLAGMTFDVIVSNPPYIKTADLEILDPEIRLYEPRAALDGGPDGLRFYREIIVAAGRYLNEGGIIVLELGDSLSCGVMEIAAAAGFSRMTLKADYSSVERYLIIHG